MNIMNRIVWFLLLVFSTGLYAEGEPNLEVDSPSISIIKRSMSGRFQTLKPLLDQGIVGLTREGLVAIRMRSVAAPAERNAVERLVTDENKDRTTLYREIARANGRPDWETDLKRIFGERWISRAPAGWYINDSKGDWTKK